MSLGLGMRLHLYCKKSQEERDSWDWMISRRTRDFMGTFLSFVIAKINTRHAQREELGKQSAAKHLQKEKLDTCCPQLALIKGSATPKSKDNAVIFIMNYKPD